MSTENKTPKTMTSPKSLINEIELDPVYGSTHCAYSVIENKLVTLYKNQEKLLLAIKLLSKISK